MGTLIKLKIHWGKGAVDFILRNTNWIFILLYKTNTIFFKEIVLQPYVNTGLNIIVFTFHLTHTNLFSRKFSSKTAKFIFGPLIFLSFIIRITSSSSVSL